MNQGRFTSIVTDDTWEAVRWLLARGHRAIDAERVYSQQGVTLPAIYTRNSRKWHIPLKRGASRGLKCTNCKLSLENYRGGKCQNCFNISQRTGRPTANRHWNWQGGKTKTAEYIRFTPEYKAWRKAVFERDNYTCKICNQKGLELNADHIKPQSLFPELIFDINNGRTLCAPCHRKTDTYGERAKKLTREDFSNTI